MKTLRDDTRATLTQLSQVAVFVILVSFTRISFSQADQNTTQVDQNTSTAFLDRRELLQEVDQQFVKLNAAKRNGDPFSIELADNYLQYAALLTEADAYDEANAAYEQALHIQRSNHGINAIEQLPTLEALFDNHLITGNIENADSYVARALRIEKENINIVDRPSATMQLKLGHYFLSRLEASSLESEASAKYLRTAHNYFMAVIDQNKHRRLDQVNLPYGEVAMTNYLGTQISRKPEFIYEQDSSVPVTSEIIRNQLRGRALNLPDQVRVDAPNDDLQYNDYLDRSYPRATNALKEHFLKASEENNAEQALYATIGLGDFNFMLGRNQVADEYYEVAWKIANILPSSHSIKLALNQPVRLPEFNYAYEQARNKNGTDSDETVLLVPMKFNVDDKGRLRNISAVADIEKELWSKAERALRQMIFRPALAEGKRSTVKDFVYSVPVRIN